MSDLGLYSGKKLSEEEFIRIQGIPFALCKQRALQMSGASHVAKRASESSERKRRKQKENADLTVEWLSDLRLLDDAQYAAMCVRHYAAKGYGKGKIQNELFRRGVPREFWETALEQLPDQDDTIDRLLRKKIRSENPDRDELHRAMDYLYRRGFRRDEINAAVARWRTNLR